MKDWKIIRIKGSRLRNLRKNLRMVLCLAYQSEVRRLRKVNDLYRARRRLNMCLTPSQVRRECSLTRTSNELIQAYNKSILICSSVGNCESSRVFNKSTRVLSLDLDMGWNPINKEWICDKCINFYQNINQNCDGWFNKGEVVNEIAINPCKYLEYCPYGVLVEIFRLRPEGNKYSCSIFGHDCPAFYLSINSLDDNPKELIKNLKLNDSLEKYPEFFGLDYFNNRENIIESRKNISKPCLVSGICPYGPIYKKARETLIQERFSCPLFEQDCPVYYYSEM